ncbi:hypothetical protein [Paenibacillus foliorum]|uniref:hypothetical protein n=1 Tax=Paenibacillus foliorum TaxID=2654974 RepID=UPI00149100CE|nr:hypothetical protein [Paenibacillus foliorum]
MLHYNLSLQSHASLEAEILVGDEHGNIRPESKATRATTVEMLQRLLKALAFIS